MELKVDQRRSIDERALLQYCQPEESLTSSESRTLAITRRRIRVAILIKEEGLRHGTIARVADWLKVSPSTIRRDINILIANGDLSIYRATDGWSGHRQQGTKGSRP